MHIFKPFHFKQLSPSSRKRWHLLMNVWKITQKKGMKFDYQDWKLPHSNEKRSLFEMSIHGGKHSK